MISSTPRHELIRFPVGELHVRLVEPITDFQGAITFEFERTEEIVELLLLADAFKRNNVSLNQLIIPYVPFARYDRVMEKGDCLPIAVFANLINGLNAKHVFITDPHSDVTPALINNVHINTQLDVFHILFNEIKTPYWLISPDAGATKKIQKFLPYGTCLGLIECRKARETHTGRIIGVEVYCDDFKGYDCYMVDDICDGGRTFIELAKIIKTKNAGKIVLLVSHAYMTKGIQVFDGLIDEIYTRKGRVK